MLPKDVDYREWLVFAVNSKGSDFLPTKGAVMGSVSGVDEGDYCLTRKISRAATRRNLDGYGRTELRRATKAIILASTTIIVSPALGQGQTAYETSISERKT